MHECVLAEDQVISTDPENILIRCFMRKRGSEAMGAVGKDRKNKGSGADKGKRPADTSAEGGHAKRSHSEAGPSGAANALFLASDASRAVLLSSQEAMDTQSC